MAVRVTSEEITELKADPSPVQVAVNDHQPLTVYGKALTSGLQEMFPQPDLKIASRKTDTVDVIGGEDVYGKAVGSDTINVAWRDKLKIDVPVNVAANVLSGLEIRPHDQTISPGQQFTYEVSAMRGSNRVILTPADGVRLSVTDPAVAGVVSGTMVQGAAPGQTKVIADYGGQKAEGVLNVVPAGEMAVTGVGVGTDNIYDDHGGGRVLIDGGGSRIIPAGKVVGLVFEPHTYQQGVQALPQTAKLLRQYENGGFDDVSNDPNVKVTEPNAAVVKIEKVDGGWKIIPVAPGTTKMTALLDGQSADMAIIMLGDGDIASNHPGVPAGRLKVPDTVSLWPGETQVIPASIDPGGGQPLTPVEATVKPPTARES